MQGNGVSSNYHKSHSSTKLKTYPIYSKSNFNERQIEDNHVNLESEYNHHETPTEETKQSTPELIDDSQSNSGLDDDDDDGTSKKTWGYNIWAIISVLSVTAGVIIAVTPIALCWYKLR